MSRSPEPQWQPISQLPLLASMIDGMFKDTQDQYQLYLQAKERPHVLDDATVQRAIRVHRTQLEDLALYEQQCARWQKEPLMDPQRQEVKRLTARLGSMKELSSSILALLDQIQSGTIDRVLRKSDLELGLDSLLDPNYKPPSRADQSQLTLPNGVTSKRMARPDGGVSFEFSHATLGALGQISAIPDGAQTEMRIEVAAIPPGDPTQAPRLELFDQIVQAFESQVQARMGQNLIDPALLNLGNMQEAVALYTAFINVESTFEMEQLVRKLSSSQLDQVATLAHNALRGASAHDRIAIQQRLDDLQHARTSPPSYSPAVGWIDDFIQARTDVEAEKLLRSHPELLTPQAEREWDEFWAPDRATQLHINRRRKLWQRAYTKARRKGQS